uniref:aprataxin and PNK-like factor n=1 Tax=Semicossyphus pulcher TaxID=241346 RepID=UPI0037E8075C
MSGFDLVPVDGGDPISLPPGETVLGRGPFLGVGDRRVSRNHAVLENLNGQLRLKSTHLNPCFIQSSPTDDPQPLQRNSWYPLHHGDVFSLLPGQYIYKVVAAGEGDRTPRNSQMFDEGELPVSLQPDVLPPPPPIGQHREQTPPQEEPAAAARSNKEEVDSRPKSLDEAESVPPSEVKDEHRNPPSVPRRRVLPAWMMGAGAASSSGIKVQSPLKRSKAPAAASTSSKRAAAKQATPAEISSEEAELSAEEQPKKRRRKMNGAEKEALKSKTDVSSKRPVVQPQPEPSRPEVSDESDGFTMDVDEGGRGGETSTADMSTKTQTDAPSKSEDEDKKLKNGGQTSKRGESVGSNSSSAPSKPRLRTPCPYGKDCYRKNPIHFQDCSHPGDTDYEEEEEEEEADLPECPYGTDCYRKNPLHRKEYKHTGNPASMTRTRPKKTPAYDDDEDEDSGDEDSFINDDSEEAGDDSDYVPPVSDDSEKEDIQGLQREAEALLKRRK